MTEPVSLRDRLERLANRGEDRGPEWLIESVNRALTEPAAAVESARRPAARPLIAAAVAFAAVAAVLVAVIAFVPQHHGGSPTPGTTPPSTVTPVSAFDGQTAFFSANEGWVCHVPLEHTLDGGATWQRIGVDQSGLEYNLETCAFAAGGHAWITNFGQFPDLVPNIARVVVGGHPAVTFVPIPGATRSTRFLSLAFADALHGWALTQDSIAVVGDNGEPVHPSSTLYRTTDGGAHWERIATKVPVGGRLHFTSPTNGWGLTLDGVERTDDGGRTWHAVPAATAVLAKNRYRELWSMNAFGDRIVVAGIERTVATAAEAKAFKHASHEQQVAEARRESLEDLFVYVSDDGGARWTFQPIAANVAQPQFAQPWEFIAVDADHWRYVDATSIVITDDAGQTWQVEPNTVPLTTKTDVTFITPDIGYAAQCGLGNAACRSAVTTDAGKSWRFTQPSGS
jgi:photosystem II stability/assembly factor-like uncharacterized protein